MLVQLLEVVESYLDGQVAIRDLETWLVSNLQSILDSGDECAVKAADEIDANLVEHSMGLLDEAALQGRLRELVFIFCTGTVVVDLFPPEFPSYRSEATSSSGTSRVAVVASEMGTPVNYRVSLVLV